MPEKKWEYATKVLHEGTLGEQREGLNKLGNEGWELVGIAQLSRFASEEGWFQKANVAYLKREIQVKESDLKTC